MLTRRDPLSIGDCALWSGSPNVAAFATSVSPTNTANKQNTTAFWPSFVISVNGTKLSGDVLSRSHALNSISVNGTKLSGDVLSKQPIHLPNTPGRPYKEEQHAGCNHQP
jgi:hypothetical protein